MSPIGDVVDVGAEIESQNRNEQVNFVYEIVYPEQFNLKVSYFIMFLVDKKDVLRFERHLFLANL